MNYGYKYAKWAKKCSFDYDDPHGKYLLARYCLLDGILTKSTQQIKKGLHYMKESASRNNNEAQEFLEIWRENHDIKL